MKLFFAVLFTILIFQQTKAYDQLVGWPGGDIEVSVKSRSLVDGVWECDGSHFEIRYPLERTTNISFSQPGIYRCTYNRPNLATPIVMDETSIRVEPYDLLPLKQLSSSLVYNLMSLQYNYLTLSHRYYATKTYFPKIAKFFRGYMDKTAEMLDQVVTYILAKQVTTSSLDGSNPPNYLKELFNSNIYANNGLAPQIHVAVDRTPRLADAFSKSFNMQREIVQILTRIGLSARELGDIQLEEFIFADLVPPLMKSMKTLTDHRNTLRSVTMADAGLGEFMFEREFS